jgi:hypothetical protein
MKLPIFIDKGVTNMPLGTSVMNYASKAGGYAMRGWNAYAGAIGNRTLAAAALGGISGASYEMAANNSAGTLTGGLKGFAMGAAMGAGAYRYGGAMYRGGRSTYRAISMGRTGANYSGAGLAGLTMRGAGRRAFRQIRNDAMSAYSHIGKGINKGFNAFKGLQST